jgi:hypothetical protein
VTPFFPTDDSNENRATDAKMSFFFSSVIKVNIVRLVALLLAMRSLAAETGVSSNSTAASQTDTPAQSEAVPSWSGAATNAHGESLARIRVYTSETPDLNDWGRRAGELCAEWYPKIASLLPSDGFSPPAEVEIRFRPNMRGVAATSGDVIRVSASYVRGHTNDFGMVIHELTHVVQSYHRRGNPGWLVEGVADYIRLTHFEPKARRPRINPEKASYRDSYKTTAIFLEWVEKTKDQPLVKELNRSMRDGTFDVELFKTRTGKTVDELWEEFTETLRQPAGEPAASDRKPAQPDIRKFAD